MPLGLSILDLPFGTFSEKNHQQFTAEICAPQETQIFTPMNPSILSSTGWKLEGDRFARPVKVFQGYHPLLGKK